MSLEKGTAVKSDIAADLQQKLEAGTARVGVVGLGYVGLPLTMLFARKGFSTVGIDIDSSKIEKLGRGESYIRHISAEGITELLEKRRLEVTADFAIVSSLDACILCVPTPLDEHREPDLSYIRNTAEDVSRHLRP